MPLEIERLLEKCRKSLKDYPLMHFELDLTLINLNQFSQKLQLCYRYFFSLTFD